MNAHQKRQRPQLAGVDDALGLGGLHEHDRTGTDALQRDIDAAREERIELLRLQLLGAASADDRRQIWREMKDAIGARSPEQVERMERERGLRSQ